MNVKRFIFELPIVDRPYSPETCLEDYGSVNSYNPDFSQHVYAQGNILDQLFKDAIMWCYHMQTRMLVQHKTEGDDPKDWSKHLKDTYEGFGNRVKYWEKLQQSVKCVRSEDIS